MEIIIFNGFFEELFKITSPDCVASDKLPESDCPEKLTGLTSGCTDSLLGIGSSDIF